MLEDYQEVGGNKLDEIVTDKPSDNSSFDETTSTLTGIVEAEDSVDARIETVTIKNDYFNSKTRKLNVTKSWAYEADDLTEEEKENLRPESVKVRLMYAKAEKGSDGSLTYGMPVPYDLKYLVENDDIKQVMDDYEIIRELNASNEWTASFENLPIYDWDGNEYQYSVEELSITPNSKWEELGLSVSGTPAPERIENTNIFKVFGVDPVMTQDTETNEWKEKDGEYEVRGVFAAISDGIKLSDDDADVSDEATSLDAGKDYVITNMWIPAEKLGTGFMIKKIDSETGEPLQNAVFVMKPYEEDAEGAADAADSEDGSEVDEETEETEEAEVVFEVVTDENGFGTFPELPVGRYILWEKTAPEGYLPIPDEMKLIVNIRKDLVEVSSDNDRNWRNRYEWSNELIHAAGDRKSVV